MNRPPTCTVTDSNELVPWLAARGPLAYTPENPPRRDYFFQYGWILPDILNPAADRRKHRYFGAWHKDDAIEIFAFWNNARAGQRTRIHVNHGTVVSPDVTAPMAVYLHESPVWRRPSYLLIQHGSYQCVSCADQPEMADGLVYLYRGIQEAKVFEYPRMDRGTWETAEHAAWIAYQGAQAEMLSDSAASFNSIHDRTARCETGGLRDRSRVSDEIARRHGLALGGGGFPETLWQAHHQCFSLERWVAERKFGPNFVVVKTPLSNLRITTFFAGEAEAKIIDPGKVRLVDAVGCDRGSSSPGWREQASPVIPASA